MWFCGLSVRSQPYSLSLRFRVCMSWVLQHGLMLQHTNETVRSLTRGVPCKALQQGTAQQALPLRLWTSVYMLKAAVHITFSLLEARST